MVKVVFMNGRFYDNSLGLGYAVNPEKFEGGKGNEEDIKKNRCSVRMTAVDILNSKSK